MPTKAQMEGLREHWSLVIKQIDSDIEFIPRGNPDSIDTLLATWENSDTRPTEAELLYALVQVEDHITEAAAIRADILAKVEPSVGISTDWIVLDATAKASLLMVLLLKLGAFDEDGLLRPTDEWA